MTEMIERHGLLIPATTDIVDTPTLDEPPLDGYTDKVRHLEALAAEADRIRALPTVLVLERRQQLTEAATLADLDAAEHARRLAAKGDRERAELRARASSAAARRRLDADVDIRALALSRRRRRWSSIAWTVLVLAMSFTAVNVQAFAAGSATAWSPTWIVAWGVDPLLSLLVVGLLLARGDLVVLGVQLGEGRARWVVRAVEMGALGACLLMNVSPTLVPGARWQSVALHIVVPLAGMASALVLPVVQEHYSTAITDLYRTVRPDVSGRPDAASGWTSGRPDTAFNVRKSDADTGEAELSADDRAVLAATRAAIEAGELPARPSGHAIYKHVMNGRGDRARAYRVVAAI